MITATPPRPALRAPIAAPPRRGPDLAVGALCAAAVAAATCWLLGLPTSHLVETMGLYVVLAALILRHLTPRHGQVGIGPANRVTLARATLVLPLAALALHPRPLDALGYAWIVALAIAAMALDGLDGKVARRTGTSSAFGARFDMELDALLLMSLSVQLWQSGKIGSWVILIGGLRYLFVLAGLVWPALQGELPPSLRRKSVCVWQGVALLLALTPVTSPALAALVAGTALALLVWSFGVDVRWLADRAPAEHA
jgi:phosphatidylglycerophosphate synthase